MGETEVVKSDLQQSEVKKGSYLASAIGMGTDHLHVCDRLPYLVLVQQQLVDRIRQRGSMGYFLDFLRPRGDHQGHPLSASDQACPKLVGTGQTAVHRPPRKSGRAGDFFSYHITHYEANLLITGLMSNANELFECYSALHHS